MQTLDLHKTLHSFQLCRELYNVISIIRKPRPTQKLATRRHSIRQEQKLLPRLRQPRLSIALVALCPRNLSRSRSPIGLVKSAIYLRRKEHGFVGRILRIGSYTVHVFPAGQFFLDYWGIS